MRNSLAVHYPTMYHIQDSVGHAEVPLDARVLDFFLAECVCACLPSGIRRERIDELNLAAIGHHSHDNNMEPRAACSAPQLKNWHMLPTLSTKSVMLILEREVTQQETLILSEKNYLHSILGRGLSTGQFYL